MSSCPCERHLFNLSVHVPSCTVAVGRNWSIDRVNMLWREEYSCVPLVRPITLERICIAAMCTCTCSLAEPDPFTPFTRYAGRSGTRTQQYSHCMHCTALSSTGRPWRKLDHTPWISNLIKNGTCQNDFCASGGLASSQGAALSMSYQQLTSSMDDWLHLTVICELYMLFMSEVTPPDNFRSHKNHFATLLLVVM